MNNLSENIEILLAQKNNTSDNQVKIEIIRQIFYQTQQKSNNQYDAKTIEMIEQNLTEYQNLKLSKYDKMFNPENDLIPPNVSRLKDPSYYLEKYCSSYQNQTEKNRNNTAIKRSDKSEIVNPNYIKKNCVRSFENEVDINLVANSITNNYLSNPNQFNSITTNQSVSETDIKDIQETSNQQNHPNEFRTGLQQLAVQNYLKKQANQQQQYPSTSSKANTALNSNNSDISLFNYGATKKSLGSRRTTNKFIPPVKQPETVDSDNLSGNVQNDKEPIDERLRGIDPKMIELIRNEIMVTSSPIGWDDVAGLKYAKTIIKEAVVLPILRPDIFTGLRRPPKGILLFGPPGTGKTLLGKCIASQLKSTFFSISASSLTSKWIGDGEKMVRALFAVASVHQPSVVFIDEIDSLLCQRSESEHESSRRLKTEFLVQLDGVATGENDRILIVGATNRPQELDEAARRRLTKRLYIPLPELPARIQILADQVKDEKHNLNTDDINKIGEVTDGYSGADIKTLCHEASMGPIRSIPIDEIESIDCNDVRQIELEDFIQALTRVRSSVAPSDLIQYVKWDEVYGSGGMKF